MSLCLSHLHSNVLSLQAKDFRLASSIQDGSAGCRWWEASDADEAGDGSDVTVGANNTEMWISIKMISWLWRFEKLHKMSKQFFTFCVGRWDGLLSNGLGYISFILLDNATDRRLGFSCSQKWIFAHQSFTLNLYYFLSLAKHKRIYF